GAAGKQAVRHRGEAKSGHELTAGEGSGGHEFAAGKESEDTVTGNAPAAATAAPARSSAALAVTARSSADAAGAARVAGRSQQGSSATAQRWSKKGGMAGRRAAGATAEGRRFCRCQHLAADFRIIQDALAGRRRAEDDRPTGRLTDRCRHAVTVHRNRRTV